LSGAQHWVSFASHLLNEQDWFDDRPWIDEGDARPDHFLEDRALLEDWQRDGVVVLERAVDPALIDELLGDVTHLLEHPQQFELSVERRALHVPIKELRREDLVHDTGIKLNSIHSISLAAARLSLTAGITRFLSRIFLDPPVVLQSLTFLRGSAQPVHLDYPYVRCQTKIARLAASWIALEDVTPEAGPLAYFPGSHKVERLGFYDWGQGSILLEPESQRTPSEFADHLYRRLSELGIQRRTFLPKKGDVLIWHGALAHEGLPVRDADATRRSYITHYTSLRAYPRAHMKADALESGAYLFENGGYAFEYPWLESSARLPSWGRRALGGELARGRASPASP
jgi:phytanoyl-CoA hydroxylase